MVITNILETIHILLFVGKMINIETLKHQRSELLEMRQRLDKEDKINLYLINEELRDINSHIQALSQSFRKGKKHSYGFITNIQQYKNWFLDDSDNWEESFDKAEKSLSVLTKKQYQVFSMRKADRKEEDIATDLGVNVSTISRNLNRAIRSAQIEFKRLSIGESDDGEIDLSNPVIAKNILSFLMPKQIVCLYLYYGLWLSLREIEEIMQVSYASIMQNICRGLSRIGFIFDNKRIVLKNFDKIDFLMCGPSYNFILKKNVDGKIERKPREKMIVSLPPIMIITSYGMIEDIQSIWHQARKNTPRMEDISICILLKNAQKISEPEKCYWMRNHIKK